MSALVTYLASLPPGNWDTVLHLGAGSALELEALARLGAERIVLVEGDPETADRLRGISREHPTAEVRQCVLAPSAGALQWQRFNLPAFNGPLEPDGLEQAYPRVRLLDACTVQTTAVEAFLDALMLGDDVRGLLIVDLPGQEAPLLQATPARHLLRFPTVLVRGARKGLWKRSCVPEAVDPVLEACHYRVVHADRAGELWPLRELVLDGAAACLHAVEIEATLLLERQQVEARVAAATEAIASQRDAQASLAREHAERAVALARENEALREAGRQDAERIQSLAASVEDGEKALAQLRTRVEELGRKLAESQDALALAVRMQALREADLTDLQRRYGELRAAHQVQHELLGKVSERLLAAHDCLKKLSATAEGRRLLDPVVGPALAGDLAPAAPTGRRMDE